MIQDKYFLSSVLLPESRLFGFKFDFCKGVDTRTPTTLKTPGKIRNINWHIELKKLCFN